MALARLFRLGQRWLCGVWERSLPRMLFCVLGRDHSREPCRLPS